MCVSVCMCDLGLSLVLFTFLLFGQMEVLPSCRPAWRVLTYAIWGLRVELSFHSPHTSEPGSP